MLLLRFSCQSRMMDSDWFSHLLLVAVPSSNWLPDAFTYGDNLQSAICRVAAVRRHFPASFQHVSAVPPPLMSGCGVPSLKQATISAAWTWRRGVGPDAPPPATRSRQMASPSISDFTHKRT